jgi:putative membrane protein
MKRTLLISGAFAAMLAMAACGEKNEVVEDGPVENASAESGVGSNPVSNAAQDAASAAVGTASAVTAGRTTGGFVTNAAIGDMYEIESSRLAEKQSKSADLKKFAAQMIKDHTMSSAELKKAAAGVEGATIPTAMDERRQGMIDNLKQAGDKFDEVYHAQQTAAHSENVALHRTYAENGDNVALKALAAKHLPIIEGHLKMAEGMGGHGGAQAGAAAGGGAAADRAEQ